MRLPKGSSRPITSPVIRCCDRGNLWLEAHEVLDHRASLGPVVVFGEVRGCGRKKSRPWKVEETLSPIIQEVLVISRRLQPSRSATGVMTHCPQRNTGPSWI